ncbi:MAG: hypothetical protein AB7N76_00300 [Planctomycetota bacterium]
MARLLLYALGGGFGHLTRALSLGRAAARRGHAVHALVNTAGAEQLPAERLAAELGPRGVLERLSPALGPAECAAALTARAAEGFDALVVDTFPRGLGGELPALWERLPALKVWVHRDLAPRYVERFALRDWAARYALVLVPGEEPPLADLPQARRTAPWLVRERAELPTRAAARARLGAGGERPLVVVVGSGTTAEQAAARARRARLAAALPEATLRYVGPDAAGPDERSCWPLLELLPGVDLLVGAGGYHTVHEARATGTPLLALPQPRRYDRQERRLHAAERCRDEAELIARARAALARPRPPLPGHGWGGVTKALSLLEGALAGALVEV